jgi:hypothetical protein
MLPRWAGERPARSRGEEEGQRNAADKFNHVLLDACEANKARCRICTKLVAFNHVPRWRTALGDKQIVRRRLAVTTEDELY